MRNIVLAFGAVLLIAGAASAQVQMDISAAMNFDAVGTDGEITQANTHVGVNRRLHDIFAPAGVGIWYRGVDHWFANQYGSQAYYSGAEGDGGLTSTVTSPYGTYSMGPYDTVPNIAAEVGTPNAVRVGTSRGKSTPDVLATTTVTIDFEAGQQAQYYSINLLMTGTQQAGESVNYGVANISRRAWVTVTANYGDLTTEAVWTGPRSDVFEGNDARGPYGDDRDNIPGGIPLAFGYVSGSPLLEQAYKDSFNNVSISMPYLTSGGDSGLDEAYSYARTDTSTLFMYDIYGGILVDSTKTLVGIDITVDNGPNLWQSGYNEGDTVNVYGIIAVTAADLGDPDADKTTVEAFPPLIPDDESLPSVITVKLRDDQQILLTGYAADLSVAVAGTGGNTISAFAEVSTGVYEATFTNDTAGDKVLTVTVDLAPAGAGPEDVVIAQTPTVTVFALTADPDNSTATAAPALIPSDESVPSVVQVTLKDLIDGLVSGYAADISIGVAGTGVSTISAFTEVSTGVYEATFTNDTDGLKVLTVTVDELPAGPGPEDAVLTQTPTVFVYTQGVTGPPIADAGPDQRVEDIDNSGDEDVTLDGSLTSDPDGSITNYSWVDKGLEIATNATEVVTLTVGLHQITLTVTDDNTDPYPFTDSDEVWVQVFAYGIDPDEILELDISSGFNMDTIVGALEFQEIFVYGAAHRDPITYPNSWQDPNLKDLKELQGSSAEGVEWEALTSGNMLACATSSGGFGEPYGSSWYDDTQLLPENGSVASTYYMASHTGNPVLLGDWTEVADPIAGPDPEDLPNMPTKSNVMCVKSAHSTASTQIISTTATLPGGQQAQYDFINFLFAAGSGADGARNMQIVAIYDDTSEDILYSWPTAEPDIAADPEAEPPIVAVDNRYGPCATDSISDLYDPFEFNAIEVGTHCYSSYSGNQGNVGGDRDYTLFEFASPLELDGTKVLAGIRLEDVNPGLNWNGRGINIFAASIMPGILAEPPDVEVTTENGTSGNPLTWVYQNFPVSDANGSHKVALTVTVNNLNGNTAVTVTVVKQAASGPGEVVIQAGATDLEKLILGSPRGDGNNGALVLDVICQGDIAATPTTLSVPFECRIIGDVDGNGGAEPGDVSLLINKLNGVATPTVPDEESFDMDANGGAEPTDVSIVINVLNGLL